MNLPCQVFFRLTYTKDSGNMSLIMTEIQKYIKTVRKKLGLTQAQMAMIIKKKRYSIANYETGRAIPPGNVLLAIQKLEKTRLKEKAVA